MHFYRARVCNIRYTKLSIPASPEGSFFSSLISSSSFLSLLKKAPPSPFSPFFSRNLAVTKMAHSKAIEAEKIGAISFISLQRREQKVRGKIVFAALTKVTNSPWWHRRKKGGFWPFFSPKWNWLYCKPWGEKGRRGKEGERG